MTISTKPLVSATIAVYPYIYMVYSMWNANLIAKIQTPPPLLNLLPLHGLDFHLPLGSWKAIEHLGHNSQVTTAIHFYFLFLGF
jgi:hypothetical protein